MRIPVVFLMLAALAPAREVTVTLLATTDMHGNIYPYDYLTGKVSHRGLARIATLIRNERKTAPLALLVDCGDTIQGTPLESVYQHYVTNGKLPLNLQFADKPLAADPMMLTMNHLRYDAMAAGNHEYNYGLRNMDRARQDAKFPWLSANTKTARDAARKPFEPYVVKTVDGVRVGIVGITTPSVPNWEKPENYAGYSFGNGRIAAESATRELRERHKVDLVVVIAHSGLDSRDRMRPQSPNERPRENMANELARIPGVDVVIFGHTHNQVEEMRIGDTLLTQPKNWAMSASRVDVKLESAPGGGYRVVSKTSRILPVTAATEADPEVLRLIEPYHRITEQYLNSVVAEAGASIDASRSRIEDTAMIDTIHRAQLFYAKADVSFASSFNPRASIAKGPLTVRQLAALYLYDNELYAIEGNGRMVKDALEVAARFFNTCPDVSCTAGPLINRAVIGYNYDMAQGVTYEVDLTRPLGDRIRNLSFRGKPLRPDQQMRIAVNNYRAGGSNGYTMFKTAKVIWRSHEMIRDLLIRYYADRELPVKPDDNWRVVPAAAQETLRREIRRDVQSVFK